MWIGTILCCLLCIYLLLHLALEIPRNSIFHDIIPDKKEFVSSTFALWKCPLTRICILQCQVSILSPEAWRMWTNQHAGEPTQQPLAGPRPSTSGSGPAPPVCNVIPIPRYQLARPRAEVSIGHPIGLACLVCPGLSNATQKNRRWSGHVIDLALWPLSIAAIICSPLPLVSRILRCHPLVGSDRFFFGRGFRLRSHATYKQRASPRGARLVLHRGKQKTGDGHVCRGFPNREVIGVCSK